MVLGNGGVEEREVKANLFKKKIEVGSKGARVGTLCLLKRFTKIQNIHHVYFQSASVICCLGFR